MSVFNDFHQVWLQRFPDAPLPGAWEEHVRLNLAKHKQKLSMFKEELRKEEIYVEYLERLLQDISKQKEETENRVEHERSKHDTSDVIPADNVLNAEAPTGTGINLEESETFSANMCVTEISKELSKITAEPAVPDPKPDPSTFVTVIEVNGLKSNNNRASAEPPKLPIKPDLLRNTIVQSRREHRESIDSSTERLSTIEEPYYDVVAAEDVNFLESDNSSNENTLSSTASHVLRREKGSQSPSASNYVNIEYFIQATNHNEDGHSSSEEDMSERPERIHNGSYASSSSLESSTPSSKRKFLPEPNAENAMYKCILENIVASEMDYVEWLNVLLNYMKAMQGNANTSQPVVTEAELSTIFFKIPELQKLHSNFLNELRSYIEKSSNKFGECFKTWASNLEIYGSFLNNYANAVDTVRKRCDTDPKFSEIVKNITPKHLSKQPVNLEDILHKPVARVQKNALVLHDLLKSVSKNHPEYHNLNDALQMTQTFLDQFNMIQTKSMFPVSDRAQRRLVKNSFIVESADTGRKLRHLFLFNDVIACAKYKVYLQSSSRNEKYTFELKWFIPVDEITIESQVNITESATNIVSLKSQVSNVRDQLRQEEKVLEDKKLKSSRGSDKIKKRLNELESQLLLVSPNLQFVIRSRTIPRPYVFYLSSEFERTQWIEAINTLKKTGRPPPTTTSTSQFSMIELQTWITACRAFLKTNMGSYLLRSPQDENLLVGDLHLHIFDLTGFEHKGELFVVFEVDSYGHFFQKAKTRTVQGCNVFQWNEKFIVDLEGCENLRVLVYQLEHNTLVGKCVQKLSRLWLCQEPVEKRLVINNTGTVLRLNLTFIPGEVSLRRIPSGKNGALFGEKIQQVCKRQKRDIPFIVTACIREVERRGMQEVGLYRVSGSSSELTRLKKSFETNSYEAEQLLKEVDIHSVTGILKLYLRELPEALFTDKLYPQLLEAFNSTNGNLRRRIELLKECYGSLPRENKATIDYILEHLMRVHKHEDENKMSMHNLATVFGPTLLRPAIKNDHKNKDTLTAGTVDVMAQAGILLCFFQDIHSMSK